MYVTMRRFCVTIVAVVHIMNIRLLPWVSSMQCACAMLSSVARPALLYFATFSHKRHDFWRKLSNTKCILIFSTLCLETFVIRRRIQLDIITHIRGMYAGLQASTRYLCQILMKLEVSRQIFREMPPQK